MKQSSILLLVFLTGILISLISHQQLNACTRIVYQGPNGTIITARSMDWNEDIMSNIWIFPRGMERNGEVGGLHMLPGTNRAADRFARASFYVHAIPH